MLDEEARRQILEEIAEFADVPARQPGDITAADVALEFGRTVEGARYWLNKMVTEGKLATAMVRDETGRRVRIWRRKEPDQSSLHNSLTSEADKWHNTAM